jgi:hypothetical protein
MFIQLLSVAEQHRAMLNSSFFLHKRAQLDRHREPILCAYRNISPITQVHLEGLWRKLSVSNSSDSSTLVCFEEFLAHILFRLFTVPSRTVDTIPVWHHQRTTNRQHQLGKTASLLMQPPPWTILKQTATIEANDIQSLPMMLTYIVRHPAITPPIRDITNMRENRRISHSVDFLHF